MPFRYFSNKVQIDEAASKKSIVLTFVKETKNILFAA